MKKQTQQQRDFDQIIDNWYDAEDEVFRLQTLNTRLQQDYNRAWERLKSQRREIDELQKKLEQHERLEHEIKALFGIEMLQAVQDFADKLKDEIKQAKIDVLSELRTYCVERENYKGIQQQQNEDLLRRNDERKFHPELTLDEISVIKSSADKANGQSTMANKVVEKIDRMIEELKK